VYPNAGHNAWTETYNNSEVFEWLLKQRKHGNA
jgi:predicted peptidase